MPELSPAALAVRDAAEKQTDLDFRFAPAIAAAALRAVIATCAYTDFGDHWIISPDDLERIATELEAQ